MTDTMPATSRQRYDRQLRYFGFFERPGVDRYRMQEALAASTVTLVGVGGVGNWVARHLAAVGVGRLVLVDGDRVELTNLNRQMLYGPADVGLPKVEVATRMLTSFNPDTSIEPVYRRITSQDDVESIGQGADLLVLTADQPMILIRRWVNDACIQLGLPWIQGSLDAYLLQVGPLYNPPASGCYTCREAQRRDADLRSYEVRAEALRRSSRARPPLIGPLCGFVGAAVAMDVIRQLTTFEPPITLGRSFLIDARSWKTHVDSVPRRADCASCGNGVTVMAERAARQSE